MKQSILTLLGIILIVCSAFLVGKIDPSAKKMIVDPRDGQSYPIVILGNLYWFASNLNYITVDSECYEDEIISCGEWGRLYPIEEFRNACPDGWRVPNITDWEILERKINKEEVFALLEGDQWKNNENASNATGLSLVPSGFKHKNKFLLQYLNSTIWFNDSTNEGSNWHFHVDGNNNEEPYYFHTHEDEVYVRKFAIRCVCETDKLK